MTPPKLPRIQLRVVREPKGDYQATAINQPTDAARFLNYLKECPEERFVVVHLNAKNEPIGLQEVSHGTLSASLVHPREVFKGALVNNSHSIIVAHNHPSGSKLEPSREDLETTEQLIKAGKLLGINVIDHLIIGTQYDEEPYSIREQHPHYWKGV